MKSTLDLLAMGEKTAQSLNHLALELDLSRNTLNQAKRRGRLSPVIAGKLAAKLDQPVEPWVVQAALEAEPEIKGTRALERIAARVRNSWVTFASRIAGVHLYRRRTHVSPEGRA